MLCFSGRASSCLDLPGLSALYIVRLKSPFNTSSCLCAMVKQPQADMCCTQHVSQRPRLLQEYKPSARDWLSSYWKGFMSPDQMARIRNTGVPMEFLKEVGCSAADLICCSQWTLKSQLGPAGGAVVGTKAGESACQLCKVPMDLLKEGALQRCCEVAAKSGLHCLQAGLSNRALRPAVPPLLLLWEVKCTESCALGHGC